LKDKNNEEVKMKSKLLTFSFLLFFAGKTFGGIGVGESDAGATPVELTSFSAQFHEGNVVLTWQTATEVNNSGFEIQRAVGENPENFEKIGFVKGAGTSNSPKEYTFVDNNVSSGKYSYRLKQIDLDGKVKYSTVLSVNIGAPTEFRLFQNYPNPFNPTTIIEYRLPKEQFVTLKIFDMLGKEVATLVNEPQAKGSYKVTFDANSLPSGIYFYRINTPEYQATGKMLLLR
jgi:hypothetical protein